VKAHRVKQQVYVERSTINNQRYLATDKGEPSAELKEEVAHVSEQSSLRLALLPILELD
jgi:hypothetical protein